MSTPDGCSENSCFTGSEMAMSTIVNNVRYIYFRDLSSLPFTHSSSSTQVRDLLTIAVHEIGHTLCLDHAYTPGSVMNPTYQPPAYLPSMNDYPVFIDRDSKQAVKNNYGKYILSSDISKFMCIFWS